MKIDGQHFRTIWLKTDDHKVVQILDQRFLPHRFIIEDISSCEEMATAIKDMHLRGAPLIGAAAAYGVYLACLEAEAQNDPEEYLQKCYAKLMQTRPTAVNLGWAIGQQKQILKDINDPVLKTKAALESAQQICDDSVERCRLIGVHGLQLIEEISKKKEGETINILTHCNAGWLACVDYGTATSPIYQAHDKGIKVHVWVDETRPRNQGARITAWELKKHGVPHTVIVDNTGGHLMQHGLVDMVIVGTDRTTRTGDVANKIGTYLKALAAKDNDVPFYVALPSSTIDWNLRDGVKEIPIEQRSADEVQFIQGLSGNEITKVWLTPQGSPAANYAFDVTPARLVTGLITERGVCEPNEEALVNLYPDES